MPSWKPSPRAYQKALDALASWMASPRRARGRQRAEKALDLLVKTQSDLNLAPGPLREALLRSYAALDIENLRNTLLQRLVEPGCPHSLLEGFPWVFGTDADGLAGEELLAAVRTYTEDLCGDDFDPTEEEVCRPDEVVLHVGRIAVIGCAHPDDGPPRFFAALLQSDDGKSFSAGELMCKLVAAVSAELRRSCHRSFRGLELKDRVGSPALWLPLYEIRFSSDWNPAEGPPEIGWERLQDLEQWRATRSARARRNGQSDPPQASTDEPKE